MNEAEIIQAFASGGGTTITAAIGFVLWKMLAAMQKIAESSAAGLDHQKSHGLRAEEHYKAEEELYRSMQEQHAIHEATSDLRAQTQRDMMALRAEVDRLGNQDRGPARVPSDRSGPIRVGE